jgi:hypothetical protein
LKKKSIWVAGCKRNKMSQYITSKKSYMSFCLKITFSYKWIFEQMFLQVVIIKTYNCLGRWLFYYIYFWINMNFENVLISYKFSVSSLEMITISNHNQNLILIFFMFSCIINYNFFSHITYIIPYLYMLKDFWNFEIFNSILQSSLNF